MSKYVTSKEANNFKKELKNIYKDTFEIKGFKDLTKKEKIAYKQYLMNDIGSIYKGQAYSMLSNENKAHYDSAKSKLDGKKANPINSKNALEALKAAYRHYESFEKPKWYHPIALYFYWKETKALKEFENNLIERGITKEKIEAAKSKMVESKEVVDKDMCRTKVTEDFLENSLEEEITAVEEMNVSKSSFFSKDEPCMNHN